MQSILENSIVNLRKIFNRQHLMRLGSYFVFCLLGLIGFGVINHYFPESRAEITGILALGSCVICFLVFSYLVIKEIIILILGPSKANGNPERTIRKYYGYCLVAYGSINLSKVQVEAINFLSPKAILAINGWLGFHKYWEQKNLDIVNSFGNKFISNNSLYRFGQINIVKQTDNLIDFEINIEFIGKSGLGTSQSPIQKYSLGIYKEVNQLQNINNKWFIKNAEWNAILL
jgi:hypothetical protein